MKTREQWAEEAIQNIRAMLLNAPDPAGWKLVPVQGTEKMMHAGEDVDRPKTYGKIWEAMIAASPEYNPICWKEI
jgi:hypothetical protein